MNKILLTKSMIQDAVESLAIRINKEFADKDPVLLCVLNGGFMFFSDLIRRLTIKHQIDFIKVSSYADKETPGQIRWLLKPSLDVEGRYVIVVDDILDTGQTASFIASSLRMHKARAIWVCVLLSKIANRTKSVFCPYVGIDIGDHFVYGYGLDLEGRERHRTNIYAK